MKRLHIFTGVIAFLALPILLGQCTQGTKKVKLRFKFEPNAIYEYRQVSKGLVRVEDPGRGATLADNYVEGQIDLRLQVIDTVPDSTFELLEAWRQHRVSRTRTDSAGSEVPERVDTTRDSIVKYVSPRGRLLDVRAVGDSTRNDLKYIQEYYRQGTPEFPAHEIAQGESWTQTTKVLLPDGPVEASTTYTIKGFSRERGYDCIIIEYDGVSYIPREEEEDRLRRDMISGLDRVDAKGHIYFAFMEGIIVLSRERWILSSERTGVTTEESADSLYAVGDTVTTRIKVEFDVENQLMNITHGAMATR